MKFTLAFGFPFPRFFKHTEEDRKELCAQLGMPDPKPLGTIYFFDLDLNSGIDVVFNPRVGVITLALLGFRLIFKWEDQEA